MNVTEHGWNGYDKEEPEILGGKPVTEFLCPPQIPRRLAREFSPVLDGSRLENKRAGFTSDSVFSLVMQVRRQQVDQGCQQVAPRSDQRRDREPEGPPATPAFNKTAPVPAAVDGSGLRLRAEGELLPAG